MKVLAISGSLRTASINSALLRAAARLSPPEVQVRLFRTAGELPLFNPDLEAHMPPQVAALHAEITASDALLIASPEYAHGVTGTIKNMLDWLVSALESINKPVLLVSASLGGPVYAHAQLLEVLRTMSMQVIDGGAHVFSRSKLDANGNITDPELVAALATGFARLAEACAAG